MTTVFYARAALYREYALAAGGLAMAAAPLALLDPAPFAAWPLGAAVIVFAAHALGTVRRHLTRVSFDSRDIRVQGPWPVSLAWHEIRGVRLRHFSTRRDGAGGWMTLSLSGNTGRITIESTLDDFAAIVLRAARAAEENGLVLDRASEQNLRHLGVDLPERRS